MYKKVYVEITNSCNLKCDFCIQNDRQINYMSVNDFKLILDKLKCITKYLYFHVLGEPLMHPMINEYIDLASGYYQVNITTNGYLINKLTNNKVRLINVSLHSYNEKYNIPLKTYMENILNKIKEFENVYFSLRLWTKNEHSKEIIKYLNDYFHKDINFESMSGSIPLDNKVFLNIEEEFIWPNLNNDFHRDTGKCYGLIDQFGILVDGSVIPCCLDSKGIINLGNIFKEDINLILNQERANKIKEGFINNKRVELLCKKCGFNIKKLRD